MNFAFILGFTTIIMGIVLLQMSKRHSKHYYKEQYVYDLITVCGTIGWFAIMCPIMMFTLNFCLWYSMKQ